MWWHTATHGREKWRGNWWMQWVASTLHTTSEHGVSSITTADAHTSAASSRLNWRPPVDLNGLVRFGERRNLVYTHVPSHFNWSLPIVVYIRLNLLMMGLGTPESCRGWRNILRISCASCCFSYTRSNLFLWQLARLATYCILLSSKLFWAILF